MPRAKYRWMAVQGGPVHAGLCVLHCYQHVRGDQWAPLCGNTRQPDELEVEIRPGVAECSHCWDVRIRLATRTTEYYKVKP